MAEDKHHSDTAVSTVLVVDDDEMTRLLAEEFLSQAGFQVVSADGADQALACFPSIQPDIVLLDVEMPEVDGYTTCQSLREMPLGGSVPILMLTGLNDAASIDLAFKAGATDFTSKPVNWSLLVHRVRYMLRSSEAMEALDRNRESLDVAQRIAGLGNWDWQRGTGELTWSDNLYRLLGVEPRSCTPCIETYLNFAPEEERDAILQWVLTTESCNDSGMKHRLLMDGGDERLVQLQIEVEKDSKGSVVRKHGVVHDITERFQAEQKIHQLAYYDSLTRLPNRALFCERLARELAAARKNSTDVAVMFLDLDNFKRVNDSLGHAYGDLLLQEVSERLLECAQQSLTSDAEGQCRCTVARMGGDEFTIMLTHLDSRGESNDFAEQVSVALSGVYELDGNDCHTSSSIGIAYYPDHGQSVDELLKCADIAMYAAKKQGKSCSREYDMEMDANSVRRYTMEEKLRLAVELDELVLHYQPQMNLETGCVEGVEALVRWHNPELGLVSPGEFIPLAEDTGLIIEIGEWVLRKACQQACTWIAEGVALQRIAVNISVLEFIRPDFMSMVHRALADSGLPPKHLELEITESLLAEDTASAVNTLQRLRAKGIQLSIDDFGTGFSNLSQLKHFPIDRLKIDQSFVQGMLTSGHDAAIVKAVLTMAESMGLRVVAEGVETAEQYTYLLECRCNDIQGYYISRPVTEAKVAAIFSSYSATATPRTGTGG